MTELLPPLLFVHIPKTGGTSVFDLLATRFAAAEMLRMTGTEASRLAQAAELGRYRFVGGHIGLGLAARFPRPPRVFTVLREPVARALSAFRDLRSVDPESRDVESRRLEGRRARQQDLLTYLEADPAAAADHLGNVQTWHLASDGLLRRDVARLGPADLERALDRLRACAVVGLTEQLGASIDLLCAVVGWPPFGEPTRANAGFGPPVTPPDERTAAALAEMTRLDAVLYRAAAERLAESLAAAPPPVFAASPGRAAADPPLAAASSELTFDQSIPGGGWHGRERIAGAWCSWTGPGRASWLDLAAPTAGPAELRFRVVHALAASQVASLQVTADGAALILRRKQDEHGWLFTARLPPREGVSGGRVWRLTFLVGDTLRPCDVDPKSADSRRLGVAIDHVSLVPVPGTVPGR